MRSRSLTEALISRSCVRACQGQRRRTQQRSKPGTIEKAPKKKTKRRELENVCRGAKIGMKKSRALCQHISPFSFCLSGLVWRGTLSATRVSVPGDRRQPLEMSEDDHSSARGSPHTAHRSQATHENLKRHLK